MCIATAAISPKRPKHIEHWRRYVSMRQFNEPRGWELQNMLLVAELNDPRGPECALKKPAACMSAPISRKPTTPTGNAIIPFQRGETEH